MSSAAGYCTGDEFILFYDVRMVGDRLEDNGQKVDAADVPDHPTLTAHLKAASGQVETAATRGGRYKVADLEGLTGSAALTLKRMVANLTWGTLLERRPGQGSIQLPQVVLDARDLLTQLSNGELIFPLSKTMDAGKKVVITGLGGKLTSPNKKLSTEYTRRLMGYHGEEA